MKPQLPTEIEGLLPPCVIGRIMAFVPHLKPKKEEKSPFGCTVSPKMESDLKKIQFAALSGKSGMYFRDLDDFLLD